NIGIEADHVVRPESRVDGLNDLLVGNLPVVPCGTVRLLPEAQFEGDMIADPDGDNGRRVFGATTVHAQHDLLVRQERRVLRYDIPLARLVQGVRRGGDRVVPHAKNALRWRGRVQRL